jgi:hypothetical protein
MKIKPNQQTKHEKFTIILIFCGHIHRRVSATWPPPADDDHMTRYCVPHAVMCDCGNNTAVQSMTDRWQHVSL